MPRQNTRLESEGAEFLVLGQLLKRGIPAYKAYTNLPGNVLGATWPETNRSARIQVKSRWATKASHFSIRKFEFNFVVFVRLNRGNSEGELVAEDPEFYVMSANMAQARVKDSDRWGYIPYNTKTFERHQSRWDLIKNFLDMPPKRKRPKAK